MSAFTVEPVVSPVSVQSFADWLRLDDTSDPLLPGLLVAATDAVIQFLQRDLLSREWTLALETLPVREPMLTQSAWVRYCKRLELPYAHLTTQILSVKAYGETIDPTEYRATREVPSKLVFNDAVYPLAYVEDEPVLVVEYIAGFGDTPQDVPEVIRTAITMAAAYMYAHRGACEAAEALTASGAATLLQPWRVRAGLVL